MVGSRCSFINEYHKEFRVWQIEILMPSSNSPQISCVTWSKLLNLSASVYSSLEVLLLLTLTPHRIARRTKSYVVVELQCSACHSWPVIIMIFMLSLNISGVEQTRWLDRQNVQWLETPLCWFSSPKLLKWQLQSPLLNVSCAAKICLLGLKHVLPSGTAGHTLAWRVGRLTTLAFHKNNLFYPEVFWVLQRDKQMPRFIKFPAG